MSSKAFGKALEPRNWFNMDAQMEGMGLPSKREGEEAAANMKAAADAERAKAEKEAADAAEAAETERREALKKRKGLAGTILTSGLGVTEDLATKFKTLLGG
jgi:hypothetical protein